MEILNIDCFSGPKAAKWLETARGLTVTDGEGSFNGGIISPQREHLKLGQFYYRLVSRHAPVQKKYGGIWWMDYETLNNVFTRFQHTGGSETVKQSRSRGARSRATFREWLALSFEWNLIEEIVIATLAARLDAYSGFGRPARGAHEFDSRAFGMVPHLSNLFTIKQFCVPELWLYQKQAFPNAHTIPFHLIERVATGTIF